MSYFQFEVEGIAHEWDTDQSEIRFMGSPVMIIWIPPLADLMRGMAELMGPAFRLAMQHGGRKSGEASFRFFEQVASLEAGLKALIHATRIAGWGLVEVVENDPAQHRAVIRQRNSWEVKLVQQMQAEHGCLFFAGHWSGIWSKVFGVHCWSRETQCQAHGAAWCEFVVEPSPSHR
jgi:predicted hydrocarbon binding protein